MDFKKYCEDNISKEEKFSSINEKSSFSNNKTSSNDYENSKNQSSSNIETEKLEKDAQKIFEQYSNFSNEQLMQELIEKTNQKMKDGSLDKQKMEQIYNSIYNFLPPENRQSLKDIFSRLK